MFNRTFLSAVSKKVFRQSVIVKSSAIPPFFSGVGGSSPNGGNGSSYESPPAAEIPTMNTAMSTQSTDMLYPNDNTHSVNSYSTHSKPAVESSTGIYHPGPSAPSVPRKKATRPSARKAAPLKKFKKAIVKKTAHKKPLIKKKSSKSKPSKKVLKPKKAISKVKKAVKKVFLKKRTNGKKKASVGRRVRKN